MYFLYNILVKNFNASFKSSKSIFFIIIFSNVNVSNLSKSFSKYLYSENNLATVDFISFFISSQVEAFKSFNDKNITGYCPCSLNTSVFSIYKSLNNFLFSSLFSISKKYFNIDIFKVFPNLLGLVNSFTEDPSFIISSIKLVLSK